MQPDWIDRIDWKKLIIEAETAPDLNYTFFDPIFFGEIQDFQEQLNIEFPLELLSLYKTTNGISQNLNDEKIGDLIWSSTTAIDRNLEMRNVPDFLDLYMPFDSLLFFADAGNGDLFGIPILNHRCPRFNIFVWNHEDDSRTMVAGYLHQFLEKWIKGNLQY